MTRTFTIARTYDAISRRYMLALRRQEPTQALETASMFLARAYAAYRHGDRDHAETLSRCAYNVIRSVNGD